MYYNFVTFHCFYLRILSIFTIEPWVAVNLKYSAIQSLQNEPL